MIEYYIQNYNNDTEEFWNKFKKSVDEEHQIIADEHIESIHAAWANEDGALKELLKYIKEQDKISSYDYECMELFFSKYDAYLEQFPESDHADYVLNNYIHFLNRCVNILQKSFSETKDPVILRYEERIKTLTNSEDTRVNRQVYVITLKDYFYYLADVRSKELEMELEMQVEDYR